VDCLLKPFSEEALPNATLYQRTIGRGFNGS
jgi:hypothetical protein